MSRRKQEINIYSIAEEAGVSIATVSRVMNRRAGVSESTRGRISEILKRYEFTPDYPETRTAKIALLVPWDDISDYFRRAIKGACRYAHENNLEINIIIKNGQSEDSMLERIRDQQCSGVIVALGGEFKQAREELAATELPCVFLDTITDSPGIGYIDNDSYAGSVAAARHLLELGHRRIGYLRYTNTGNDVDNHHRRFEGYLDAMREAGISLNPAWIQTGVESNHSGRGFILTSQLLSLAPEITAIMTVDDQMAMGAISTLHRAGLRVPHDVSVIGFDNMTGTENWFPALSTVEHPLEQAGYLAAENIAIRIKSPNAVPVPRLTLPTRLIIRESTAPPHINTQNRT